MGSQTTTFAVPYPVGTDRVMDGDNAMQAMAERLDLLLGGTGGIGGGGGLPANAPGQWQAATGMVVCTDASLTAVPGASVSRARFMKIGKTVWYQGEAGTGSASAVCCITLPNAQAGAPSWRNMNCGTLVVTGGAAPAQSGVGFMHANLDRLIPVTLANGYITSPTGLGLRWSVMYETAT